jgi:hypothetical protein
MTLLLWCVGLAFLTLAMTARTQRAASEDRWWLHSVDLAPATRPAPRATAQTGVAVLALALALEASTGVIAPAEPHAYDLAAAAHAPAAWTQTSFGADGWFV